MKASHGTSWRATRGVCGGRDHRAAFRNAQDGAAISHGDDAIVLVVADGCGSAPKSELGAEFAVRWIVAEASKIDVDASSAAFADLLSQQFPLALQRLALALTPRGGSFVETVRETLLFTVVAAHITAHRTTLAACGDGVFVVNGTVQPLEPAAGNAPDYIGYRLVDDNAARSTFHVQEYMSKDVHAVAVATDGALALVRDDAGLEGLSAPRDVSGRPVPSLSDLVTDPEMLANPASLEKRLRALSLVPHLLRDDTAIAMALRHGEPTATAPLGDLQ